MHKDIKIKQKYDTYLTSKLQVPNRFQKNSSIRENIVENIFCASTSVAASVNMKEFGCFLQVQTWFPWFAIFAIVYD